MVIDLLNYIETKAAQERAAQAASDAAIQAELRSRVNLEWVLADLIADIEAA